MWHPLAIQTHLQSEQMPNRESLREPGGGVGQLVYFGTTRSLLQGYQGVLAFGIYLLLETI